MIYKKFFVDFKYDCCRNCNITDYENLELGADTLSANLR